MAGEAQAPGLTDKHFEPSYMSKAKLINLACSVHHESFMSAPMTT